MNLINSFIPLYRYHTFIFKSLPFIELLERSQCPPSNLAGQLYSPRAAGAVFAETEASYGTEAKSKRIQKMCYRRQDRYRHRYHASATSKAVSQTRSYIVKNDK